jgi:hypothetical protein
MSEDIEAQLSEARDDPAYWDDSDPGHAAAVNRVHALLAGDQVEGLMPEIEADAAVGDNLDGIIKNATDVPGLIEDVDVTSALPLGFEVDAEDAKTWQDYLYSAEISQTQINALVKQYAEFIEFDEARIEAEGRQARETLMQRYGDNFDRALHLAASVAHSIGGQDLIDRLDATGLGNSAYVIQSLIDIAERKGHYVRQP